MNEIESNYLYLCTTVLCLMCYMLSACHTDESVKNQLVFHVVLIMAVDVMIMNAIVYSVTDCCEWCLL